jgi:glucosamine kinase
VTVRFIIGIDGGGTGTRARVCNPDGDLLGAGEAGPSGLSQGLDQAWRHVLQAARAALSAAGHADAPWSECALGAGLAGTHVDGLRQGFVQAQPQAPALARLVVCSDGLTALLGAHGGRPGLVLIAGTGSVAEALWPDGRHATAGGWGFGVGDEGSGAWLGLQAVRIAHAVIDGQQPAGPLALAVMAATANDGAGMRAWVTGAGQARYAPLAPLVFEHEASDPQAAALLHQAVQDLSRLVLGLDPDKSLPIVCAGSIARRLQARLAPELRRRCVEPVGDAVDGALHLIRRALRGEPPFNETA